MQQKDTCEILVVTALPEEIQALKSPLGLSFNTPTPIPNSALSYYKKKFLVGEKTYDIAVICLNSMGNPKSSIKTSIAVNYLNPTFVIMFGLAGGIPGEVKLTDVIISDEIFYVGQGKQRPNSREIRLESLQVDALLLHRLQDYRLQLGDKS